MRRTILSIALLFLLSAGLVLGADGAAPAYGIPRFVIAGGGGASEASAFALSGTIGQAVVDNGSVGTYAPYSGFWPGAGRYPANWIYLPLVERTSP